MSSPRWLVNWDEAGRRRADRLAGREVDRTPFGKGVPVPPAVHVWNEVWAPPVYRSVHMRPAETQHIPAEKRGSAISRSLDWLLGKLL